VLRALAIGRSVSRFEKCVTLPQTAGACARLTVQRRMIAPIAELVREPVYRGAYHTPDAAELAARRILPFTGPEYPSPVTFFDTGRSARPERLVGTGFVNDFEADLVLGVLRMWDRIAGQGNLPAHPTFSVLSFYKAQAALIERRLQRRPVRKLVPNVIDSIDKIQGQESDLVVISFVRALRGKKGLPVQPRRGTGLWLQDIHRLNVAVTRARLALALVGDRPTLSRLAGNEEAEGFYANLFQGLDSGAPGMLYVADPGL
jgi:superfamily I DNA and/or RNA helicase